MWQSIQQMVVQCRKKSYTLEQNCPQVREEWRLAWGIPSKVSKDVFIPFSFQAPF
jgi:hypothetical protein